MNISDFRDVARLGNARVYLDTASDEIRVRRQTFLNRAVDWVRGRISRNPLEGTERDAAHNRFLRAIADHSGYDGGDVSRAEALLSTDVIARKPLSARRIREVLHDLDGRSSQAMRDNRTTVAWMATRGVDERLRELGAEADEGEREVLADRIGRSVHAAGRDGGRTVGFVEANAVTSAVVGGFLAERTARAEARADLRAPAGDGADARESTAGAAAADAGSASPTAPPSERGSASVEAHRTAPPQPAMPRSPPSRKDLLRQLGAAKLPRKVKGEVRKLVRSGAVADRPSLARHANRRTAEWVRENRIGRWYAEAQKHRGIDVRPRQGGTLMAPTEMLNAVARSITGSEDIVAYPAVKAQARALIAQHVGNEIGAKPP